ncbi:MAG: ubiquinol-cytochrome C chaperone [Parvibaculaceae bacterium]|nr:ubiquinol-cytochrome C chaperone [Parvibaculaceae bacterium]
MILKKLLSLTKLLKRPDTETVFAVYGSAVAQAREPAFYLDVPVPDTVDGRFEMIILHVFLLIDRLRGQGDKAAEICQQLFDTLFDDMDRSLREMGVGDLSVGKKINTMAEAFYGRAGAYQDALDNEDRDELIDALTRNIFPEVPAENVARDGIEKLADYLAANRTELASQAVDDLIEGKITFVPLASATESNNDV